MTVKEILSQIGRVDRSCGSQVRHMFWMVLVVVLLIAGVPETRAHEQDDQRSPQLQSGQLNGISHRSVEINHRVYALHPKVTFQDDEGRPKQLQDFKPGVFVQYQLKDELVRQLILVTPK